MVRVAGLMDQVAAGVTVRSPDGLTPQAALAEIRERSTALAAEQAKLWKRHLRPALEAAGIVVAEIEDLEPKELEELERVFDSEIFPVLTPLAVGPGQPFPYISGLSLSLGLFVRDPDTGEERFARVKVPELLPRFLSIGSRGLFLPLERVIRHFLSWLFPTMEVVECTIFRVTRDADFAVSDEADDLLEAVELELRRRPLRRCRARRGLGLLLDADARAAEERARHRRRIRSTSCPACSTSPSWTSWRRSTGPS